MISFRSSHYISPSTRDDEQRETRPVEPAEFPLKNGEKKAAEMGDLPRKNGDLTKNNGEQTWLVS